eukprot:NODE_3058_length_710_cov_67.019667_g2160_i0.p3 GENE.NODE_3058_length_710_cov_67.019667_g2160_i0~~NODE_3058_length_710_cov_67.019667_g2160_i0.p3  ORF type:complete len:106 (-),score=26.82 NODE_3058_length_710_cov_67.019667_g2160_i0:40-357(-)
MSSHRLLPLCFFFSRGGGCRRQGCRGGVAAAAAAVVGVAAAAAAVPAAVAVVAGVVAVVVAPSFAGGWGWHLTGSSSGGCNQPATPTSGVGLLDIPGRRLGWLNP